MNFNKCKIDSKFSKKRSKNEWQTCTEKRLIKKTSLVNWQLSKEAWANSEKTGIEMKKQWKMWIIKALTIRLSSAEIRVDWRRRQNCDLCVEYQSKKDKVSTLKVSFEVKRQVYIDKFHEPVHRSKFQSVLNWSNATTKKSQRFWKIKQNQNHLSRIESFF